MRKYDPMLIICCWLVVILFSCALLMGGLDAWQRMALLLGAGATGWVYMVCDSVFKRAHDLMQMAEVLVREKTKPPESGNN